MDASFQRAKACALIVAFSVRDVIPMTWKGCSLKPLGVVLTILSRCVFSDDQVLSSRWAGLIFMLPLSLCEDGIQVICHHQPHVLCGIKHRQVVNYKNNIVLLHNIYILGRKGIDKNTRFQLLQCLCIYISCKEI